MKYTYKNAEGKPVVVCDSQEELDNLQQVVDADTVLTLDMPEGVDVGSGITPTTERATF